MSSSQDAALQDLIKDSIIRILEHEDPGQYFKWIRSAFPTYGLTPTDRARDEDAQRVMAMGIGRAIWNATPLPGNGFRPRPLPRPGRNDRCPCGSGKKHKKCCGLSGSLPDPQIDVETILPIVLSLASPQQRSAMVKSQRLPITVLVETARDHLEKGHPRKAVGCLEPIFDDSIKRPCFEHGLALHLLCQSYGELGHNRKELAVLERLADAPAPSPLRGDARLALSDRRRAAGDLRGAREAWTLAKQDDADMPGLGICEIQLLAAEDRPQDALQRAAFWQKRLAVRTNAEPERKLIGRLIEGLREVPRTMAIIGRLEDWFDDVRGRPIPRYAVTADGGDAITLEDRLRQMGLDEDQMRQAIESFEKSEAKNEQLGEPCAEPLPEPEDDAPMHELVPPGEVAALERKWRACFPDGKPFSTQDQPMGESRAFEPSHIEAWLGLLGSNAAAADSLDILDDLATLLSGEGERNELFHAVIDRAATIVERAMTRAPEAGLPWGVASNRPALRPILRLFHWHILADDDDAALEVARFLLRINPEDNHGIRTFVMNAMLRAGDDTGALALAARYPDEVMSEMTFGRTLALVRTGDFAAAEKTLRNSFTRKSRIPEFLTRTRVTRPKPGPYGMTFGGPEEAWYYRQEMRDVWKRSDGALGWLETTVARIAREVEPDEGEGRKLEAHEGGAGLAE